jgi:DNA-directed RNA polymerase specialized sigma24 family protein
MADSGVLAKDLSYTDKYFELEATEEDSVSLVIEALLAQLPERQRTVIEMCIFSQITYTEASRQLKCSDQTVRREVLRALAFLRASLEGTPWLGVIMNSKLIEAPALNGAELPEIK